MNEYNVELNSPLLSGEKFLNLITEVGWSSEDVLSPRGLDQALKATSHHYSVWDKQELIGFARVFSDSYLFSVVADLMVHPKYQKQGVGRAIMKKIIDVHGQTILFLGAQAGNEQFFERLGFKKGPTGYERLFVPKVKRT